MLSLLQHLPAGEASVSSEPGAKSDNLILASAFHPGEGLGDQA